MLLCVFLVIFVFHPVLTGRTGGRGGGSHTYPHSHGNSGYGSTGNHYGTYQASGNHAYPASGGLSGTHNVYGNSKSTVHHHYHYHQPQQISYPSAHGPVNYPVYNGHPPVYVYEYRNSGSRFDTLLTGLALYNLGTMSSRSYSHDYNRNYRQSPSETCKLGIQRENGDYEETRVSCQLMTSFIWEEESKSNRASSVKTETVTNTTTVIHAATHGEDDSLNGSSPNVSSVTVTQTNKTVVDALSAKGPSISVTPGMKCYIIKTSPASNMRRSVPCGVLQSYAVNSFRGSAGRLIPYTNIVMLVFCISIRLLTIR